MKPLIFEYAEVAQDDSANLRHIEYNSNLNLSVSKSTGRPAINEIAFITETFTKAEVDTSDSDDNFRSAIRQSLDTRIYTRQLEGDVTGDEDRLRFQTPSSN